MCEGKQGAYDGEKSYFTSASLPFNNKKFPNAHGRSQRSLVPPLSIFSSNDVSPNLY